MLQVQEIHLILGDVMESEEWCFCYPRRRSEDEIAKIDGQIFSVKNYAFWIQEVSK